MKSTATPLVTCVDWQMIAESVMARLYRAEIARWAEGLAWDTESTWHEVERGRQLGTVSGLLALDERRKIAGWCYFLVHDQTLQIGGVFSSSRPCTTALVDQMLSDSVRREVTGVTCVAYPEAEGLVQAFRRHGLVIGRYWYLSRDIAVGAQRAFAQGARPWSVEHLGPTVDLLMRAYGPSDGSRPFAPGGTHEEWTKYVAHLVGGQGCGTLLPEASLCVPAGPDRLAAVALVSRIAAGTGHLVQLAVDPQFRRRGFASALVDGVCETAARAGCRQVTLLVDGRNAPARSLYEGKGFEAGVSFLTAGTTALNHPTSRTSFARPCQPLRSTSAARDASATTFR